MLISETNKKVENVLAFSFTRGSNKVDEEPTIVSSFCLNVNANVHDKCKCKLLHLVSPSPLVLGEVRNTIAEKQRVAGNTGFPVLKLPNRLHGNSVVDTWYVYSLWNGILLLSATVSRQS